MKKIKIALLIFVIVAGLLTVSILGFGFSYWPLVYWWLLAFIVSIIWSFKVRSGFMLWVAFLMFILSSLLISVGLRSIGETLMRLSFLGWIIGLVQSMSEYKRT